MDEQNTPEEEISASEQKEEKSISADLIRGHINTIILRALYEGDKYGYEIIAEIERKSHGQYSLKQPSLYSALKRLESQGYVTSYWGGSVGGGRRKYFSLTEEGKQISERNQSEWEYSRTVIDSLISEKQFDFSNPAPTAVDMRVLKRSTSRVPARGENGEEEYGYAYEGGVDDSLREENALLQEELERARLAFEEEKAQSEAQLKTQREDMEKELSEREAILREENERARAELEERRKLLEEDRKLLEELKVTQIVETERLVVDEEAMQKERDRYEHIIAERECQLFEEREAHARALEEQEKQIREEDAKLMEEREAQIRHENYLRLVNTPLQQTADTENQTEEIDIAEEQETPLSADEPEYRTVVRELYSNTVRAEEEEAVLSRQAASTADGMDFYDLETLAAKDGIKINTAGGGKQNERASESVVNKGKVFFFCAIVVFLFCLAEGSVILALLDQFSLPVFYPYLIWAIGLALLLVTGVAYANRYGERALRRAGSFLINAIVIYALLVIFTLILALGLKIDFTQASDLGSFVIIPVIFFFNVVIFAIAYVLQMREKR